MTIDPGTFDATLAACVGDDAALAAELRAACLTSLDAAMDALLAAGDAAAWIAATDRIEGIAASFGAVGLQTAARRAASSPLDRVVLARLSRSITRLRG